MSKQEEVFKRYRVSEEGIVSNILTGYVMAVQTSNKWYHVVMLTIGGKSCQMRVSRMVALQYLPNPMGYPEVNHKDCDKDNNHVSNLEWCTQKQNLEHAKELGLMKYGENHPRAKLKDSDVMSIRLRLGIRESYNSIFQDYKDKVSWWTFREICRGKLWKHLL